MRYAGIESAEKAKQATLVGEQEYIEKESFGSNKVNRVRSKSVTED